MLDALRPQDGACFVDATFGAGGYTNAILEAADCRVIGLDRDPSAIAAGADKVEQSGGRLQLVETVFSDLDQAITDVLGADAQVDGVVFDLGVSSMQLDQAHRGFSFQQDGPLDMRMSAVGQPSNDRQSPADAQSASDKQPGADETSDRGENAGTDEPSAADIVNRASESLLADILFHYGEERRARAIARAIAKTRKDRPITTTAELADLVARVLGRRPNDPKHPATRTFQALRIATNREFEEIGDGLAAAERRLRPGGRLVVVTFHSLEDRLVKRFFSSRTKRAGGGGSRHLPELVELQRSSFQLVNQRPLTPGEEEIAANPRARSAKLRAAERSDAPPRQSSEVDLGVQLVDLAGPTRHR